MAVVLKTEEEQEQRVTSSALSFASLDAVGATLSSSVAPIALSVAVPAPTASTRRYDQATIEKALALAAEMQQEHQATLTAEQVVRLGEEINVDQAFVLKALAHLDCTTEATGASGSTRAAQTFARESVVSGQQVQENVTELRPLPRAARYAAVFVPLLYAFLSFFVFGSPSFGLDGSNSDNLSIVLMFGGGPLLALVLGWKLRSKRLAFVNGFCVGLFLFLSAIASTRPMPRSDFFPTLFYFAAAGTLLSLTAAVCRQYGPRVFRRFVVVLLRCFPYLTAHDAQE